MKIALIVATDLKGGIGKDNDLLWHLPADMKFFKETTTDHIVVMGRKNFESIPERFRPLPNRENVVLTRNLEYNAPGCSVFHDLKDCLEAYKSDERIVFVIGGGEIYKMALSSDIVQEMYITRVENVYDADTFFLELVDEEWEKEEILSHPIDEKNKSAFTVWKYIRK